MYPELRIMKFWLFDSAIFYLLINFFFCKKLHTRKSYFHINLDYKVYNHNDDV